MRKYKLPSIVLLIVFLLWGCDKASLIAPETTDTATPQVETGETSPTEMTYPEMMEDTFAEGFVTAQSKDSNTPCQIRTRKYRKGEPNDSAFSLYIEVDTGAQVLKKEIEPLIAPIPMGSRLSLVDIDGDGIQEILIHFDTGGCGGFGSYCSWVLKAGNDDIQVLFEYSKEFDTGFESLFLEGYQMEVKNNITGYNLVFDVKDKYGAYIDASEKLPDGRFEVDPFCIFEPKDVDDDGISEILCKQYTHYLMHADYTGLACSVLKFNTKNQVFEVIDAWYEPNTET